MADMETELKQYLEAGPSIAPKDALEFAEGVDTKIVDLKFVDLLGRWQHVSLPLSAFDESAFVEGLGFDGSSIRGWQAIDKSDMLLMPDPSTATLDPFTADPTLSLICDIRDPITGGPYDKDPRFVARRAEEYLRSTGVADTAYIGPECEFFVFDSVSYDLEPQRTGYAIDSEEAHWNSGKAGLGYQIRPKEGYFPPAPHDTQQ
ncbi:MAG: glutamine synthetase beta-grasp domain-containing protein, partial [Gaiellaceae bacterium]